MTPDELKCLEPSITRRARELWEAVGRAENEMSVGSSWEDKILDWSMADLDRKSRILQFIDVFPAIEHDRDVVDHLKEYFPSAGHRLPLPLRVGLRLSDGLLTSRWVASAARLIMRKMARRFIGGETAKEASLTIRHLGSQGFLASIDFLGEATLSESEADQNLETIVSTMESLSKEESSPQINFSVKCSSLTSYLDPVDPAEVSRRLAPRLRTLLRAAARHRAFIHFDAENHDGCDLVLDIVLAILGEQEFRNFADAGIVLQAYLRDAEHRLDKVVDACNRPLTIRLVKGAYWDSEVIRAARMGWTPPVYLSKAETDACFERMAFKLLKAPANLKLAAASHNLRSIAASLAIAQELRVPAERVEFQFLYGMARATRKVLLDLGRRVRVYTPYGQLIPGMAYLVRRLLENSSNESFLRHRRLGSLPPAELLKNPHTPGRAYVSKRFGEKEFQNAPAAEFHKKETREAMRAAVQHRLSMRPVKIGPVINGKRLSSKKQILSLNPSHPARTIAEVCLADAHHVKEAAAVARRAWIGWRKTSALDRGKILRKAADILEERRMDLMALEVCEAGKPWAEAQADVAEAIDYLRYYPGQAARLDRGVRFQTEIPGETNAGTWRPRGVAAVISPWNFPLAIPAGQISSALATGNCVLFKPAEQTPLIACELFEIFRQAGVPDGALHFLPGIGEDIGPALVEHPDVDLIVFTGSRAVGGDILKRAAANPAPSGPKRVIAEMGGKNAVIVDSDADFDLAIGECLQAAFDYAGQKCSALSRLILLDDIYDAFLNRFAAAAKSYPIGFAEMPATRISPLIDSDAVKRVRGYFETASRAGRWVLPPDESRISDMKEGYFAPPGVIAVNSPAAPVAQDEIFGPLVAVLSAKTLDDALAIANGTAYALTGGFFSRHPGHIEQVRREFDVGNLYINRSITGASVGRQPFGGHRASGIGSKAGGPDYLAQFCVPVTTSENISRHGFSPDISR